MAEIKWAVGVTTVPARRADLLPATLSSLRDGGFPSPHLFVDGAADPADYHSLTGLAGVTLRHRPNPQPLVRVPGLGTAGNWFASLLELFVADPWVDRYALFQDDVTCTRNLRGYLDASWGAIQAASVNPDTKQPAPFYLNLFTFMDNELLVPQGAGWHPSVERSKKHLRYQTGRGALGLVFDRAGVVTLLSCRELIERFATRDRRTADGVSRIDGGIVHVLNKVGYREMVHIPSPLQHEGRRSTMGDGVYPQARTFRPGDDAMTWLVGLPAVPLLTPTLVLQAQAEAQSAPTPALNSPVRSRAPVRDRRLAAEDEARRRVLRDGIGLTET